MKVYVAASFAYSDKNKTNERKKIIENVIEKIKKYLNAYFYLPHQLKIKDAWNMSLQDWAKSVFCEDMLALINADLVIFISFGKESNAGSVWECGYAYAKQKPVIVIKMTDEPESLMITNTARAILTYSEIDTYDWNKRDEYTTNINKIS